MTRVPYGAWPSPLTADVAAARFVSFSELKFSGTRHYWLEQRPLEGGRSVLVASDGQSRQDLVPAPMNVRSRVYEYGGGAYALSDDAAYFVNFRDQCIHASPLGGGAPRQVTTGDDAQRFGGLLWDPHGPGLVAVRERHPPGEASDAALNDLVRVDVKTGTVQVLHEGHDFYAWPCLSPSGDRLAFVVWDHPNMPWDGTQLLIADIGADGTLNRETLVAGGMDESVYQPAWTGDDRLVFASDRGGYWNLHVYDQSGVRLAIADDAEYGLPMWSLGSTNYVVAGRDHVVAQRIEDGEAELVIADIERGITTPLSSRFTSYGSLTRSAAGITFIGGTADDVSRVTELDIATGETTTLARAGQVDFPDGTFSTPQTISFTSSDGARAYANYYPPRHPEFTGPEDELPPLLVTTHGGPTSSAGRGLSFRTQYYTSRGWAVLDVNYGGSTGFGRAYRERLNGQWGVVDVQDCVAGARHLASEGRVDINRIAIRGGSAGGYTTLAAVTFADIFRAGASHYGIGDLAALARDTHKFESRYVDRLVAEADFDARSPVRHAALARCPMIFFQGSDDRIVPPNQAEAMFAACKANGVPVSYLLFEGEGHGFRRAENVVRAIEAEYLFFARVFGFEPAEDLRDIPVENAPWT
ncbi:MAG: prolyl oligopeptidase family serine peptidase [Gammaproteobacteria bacterium]|nr:prolyl oligopeptidase family serine peptidase [Gammaproteobacteria bacterium]